MKRTTTTILAGVALAGMAGVGIAAAAGDTGPGSRVAEALKSLVSDKTLTQEQADAVAKALDDAHEEARAEREARRAERDELRAEREAELEALLDETLGMSLDDVRTQLREGQTLREIAGDDKAAEDLAAGIKALVREHLAEEVAEGHITQERADSALSTLDERVDAWLDGTGRPGLGFGLPLGGPGMGGGRGGHPHGGMRGPGGWQAGPDGTDGSEDSSGSTSTTLWSGNA